MANSATVAKFYKQVIEDVMLNVREIFADDGVDEQILNDLKQTWERKLAETKVIENAKENDTAAPTSTPATGGNRRGNSRAKAQQQSTPAPPAAPQPTPQTASNSTESQNTQSGIRPNVIPQNPTASQLLQSVVLDPSGRIVNLGGQRVGLSPAMSAPATAAVHALPPGISHMPVFQGLNATPQTVLQHTSNQTNATGLQFATPQTAAGARPVQQNRVVQLDGPNDSSEDDDDDDDSVDNYDDRDDNDEDENENENDIAGEEEDPLNSEDDVSDEDPTELFDVENVVVCQYDKITRSRNKWKFHFKDGIMNLKGKDYVFQKAIGDAEW